MKNTEKQEFYEKCSKILNIPHEWNDPVPRRTRWNTRLLGNGRFPGYGLIRCFGNSIMVVSKSGTRMFSSCNEVYDFIATDRLT